MASEVLNWDGLEVKRLKTGVFQLKDLPDKVVRQIVFFQII